MLLAQRDLQDYWAALDLTNPPRVRDALLDFIPELVVGYGDAAALLGADFYDMLRDAAPSVARFQATLARPVDTEQASAATRWAVGPLFTGTADDALTQLSGAAQRLVLQPFRDTVYESGRADPAEIRFARIPSGPTCKFCTMVASRGFVYRSAASAGDSNRWHDDCNCMIVPGRSENDYPEGFNLDTYRTAYKAGTGIE